LDASETLPRVKGLQARRSRGAKCSAPQLIILVFAAMPPTVTMQSTTCILNSVSVKAEFSLIQSLIVSGNEIMKVKAAETDTIVQMLQKTSLWSGLSNKDLKLIAKASKERNFETGETIVQKGQGGVGFYLVLEGSVEVRSNGTMLAKLGPGQFFGEMSVIDNEPRSADVVAVEPARCLILSAWSFNALMSENPRIAIKLLQEFVRRLRKANQSISGRTEIS